MNSRHMLSTLVVTAMAPAGGSAAGLDAAEGRNGLTFTAVYTGEPIRNMHGGIREGGTYLDNLDLQLVVERGHVFGMPGLSAFAYVLHNNSAQFSDEYVGDAQVVSNIDAPEATHIYEMWLDWSRDDGRFSARFGLYDLNSEFDVSDSSALFTNSSHGINPTFSLSGLNGPSIFPVTSLTLRLRDQSDSGVYWQTAILDGVPGDPDDPSSNEIRLSSEDGALLVVETGLSRGAWRKLAVGGWLYTADFDTLDETAPGGGPVGDNGNSGLYGIADRMLASGDRGELAGFLRLGYADARYNQFEYYAGAGLTLEDFWPRRADDQLGIAIATAFNGDEYRDALRLASQATDDHETVIDLSYRAPLTGWLTLQPAVQYVVDPGTDPVLDNSLVVGLRFEIAFSRSY